MDSRPMRRGEIGALTGIRFVAALLVLVTHTADILGGLFPRLDGNRRLVVGDIGVGMFFFLSGYILAYTYASDFGTVTRRGWQAFMRRRFARVWPLQAATIAFLVALVVLQPFFPRRDLAGYPPTETDWRALPGQLTLTHAWPQWASQETVPWNSPSWSISSEWFAYLLCPFALALLLRASARAATILAVAVVAAQFVLWELLDIDSGITRIFGLFFLGLYCFLVIERTRWRVPRPDIVVVVTAVAVYFLLPVSSATDARFFVILACGLLIVPLSQSTGPVARLLSSRPLLFWGRASFALYMTHDIVIRLVRRDVLSPSVIESSLPVRLAAVAGVYTLVLLVAGATYLAVERPLERRLRRPWRIPLLSTTDGMRTAEAVEAVHPEPIQLGPPEATPSAAVAPPAADGRAATV